MARRSRSTPDAAPEGAGPDPEVTPETLAEQAAALAERGRAIEADSRGRFTAALRELVVSAAGFTGFAVETVRDVVQFLVRRGQIPPAEGERLLREAAGRQGATAAATASPAAPPPRAKRARKRAAAAAPVDAPAEVPTQGARPARAKQATSGRTKGRKAAADATDASAGPADPDAAPARGRRGGGKTPARRRAT
jgi:hypothetical protein